MHSTRDKLIFRALCVLDEAIDAASEGPVKPGLGVRLALAYLYSVARRPEMRHFADFLTIAQDPYATAHCAERGNYLRQAYCRSCLYGIARACGYGETPRHWAAIGEARRTGRMILPSDGG